MIKGFVCSTFDLLHTGHLLYLKDARSQCDYLVAGLQIDPSIDRHDKSKPVETLQERYARLNACKYVDEIITYETEADLCRLLDKLNIDVLVMGSDWEDRDNPIKDLVKEVSYHDRSVHTYSSTSLRKRIQEEENKRDGLI